MSMQCEIMENDNKFFFRSSGENPCESMTLFSENKLSIAEIWIMVIYFMVPNPQTGEFIFVVFFSQLQQRNHKKLPELKNTGWHILGSYKPLKNVFQKGNSQHKIQLSFLRGTYARE